MGKKMETVTDFIFLGSKITADGDCSHNIKRRLVHWRKPMTNLDNILKSRDITLLTKVCLVKAMVLDCKEIKPVNSKGNQPWIFIGRTGAEALILWPPDVKNQITGKDFDAGKDWGQEKKGVTEDEMVGWQYRINGHEFEQTPGDSEGQGSPACSSLCGHKEWDMSLWLNKNRSLLRNWKIISLRPELLSGNLEGKMCSQVH